MKTPVLALTAVLLTACSSGTVGPGAGEESEAADADAVDGDDPHVNRFLLLWRDLHDPANGYLSPEGIPYHSVETLMVEAPDYGHQTTSETFSYLVWMEAMYGRFTGDWSHLQKAWELIDLYAVPPFQPTNGTYNTASPAMYAPERDDPREYPVELLGNSQVPVGRDPIGDELRSAYGDSIHGMHWLLDTGNWYGFGGPGRSPTFINTYQRGPQESVWETVPHPSVEEFLYGAPGAGFLGLFTRDPNGHKRQWRYSSAPDADARVVQAMYWAKRFADQRGEAARVDGLVGKAVEMGDFLRYALFDKYFKVIGCQQPDCPGAQGRESAHYLISWYYAWGGSHPQDPGGWAWRIGCSHAHFGYQNPVAAWALSRAEVLAPRTPSGADDWGRSLDRQIEFYVWLQSEEGAIAGGATNSWNGRYEPHPAGRSTFHGLAYDDHPVYHDPGSNTWFGWQAWSMGRVAEYYYLTADPRVEGLLLKWVDWIKRVVILTDDGDYAIPSELSWEGQPDPFDPAGLGANHNLHVAVTGTTQDVGVTAALARALVYYSAATRWHRPEPDADAQELARQLLDRMWNSHRDLVGLAAPEERGDYDRFGDSVYVPGGFCGTMALGDPIDSASTFLSIRSAYRRDPDFERIQAYLDGGPAPTFRYHRFWAQAEVALANAEYGRLLGP